MLLDRLAGRLQAERAPTTAVADPGSAQQITRPQRIAALLARTLEQRNLLTVAISGSDEVYSSAVLELVSDRGYLVLDELKPDSGQAHAEPGRRIHISTRVDGLGLAFESSIGQVSSAGGIPYYKVALPQIVYYHQRRSHHRATVPLARALSVHLIVRSARVITGELRDISCGGLSIRIDPGAPEQLHRGDVVPRCIVPVGTDERICAALEICYADRWGALQRPRIGGRFLDIDARTERALAAFVAALDRTQARQGGPD